MDSSELGNLARTLWSIEQIRMLKSRYFQAVDEKDYGAIAAMFTDDAIVDFSGEVPHRIGHVGITSNNTDPATWKVIGGHATGEAVKNSVDGIVTVHQGHDSQIVVESDSSATGRWSLYDMLVFPEETMHGYGHYLETYRFEGGEWKFSSLTLTRLRVHWVRN